MPTKRATKTSHRLLRAALSIGLVVAIAACGGRSQLRDAFGVTLESPDAFNVYPRRPLQMPPSMAQLPPPRPGAPSPLDPRPAAEAQAALANAGAPPPDAIAPSAGELALLGAAGATQADPEIRADLASNQVEEGESRYGMSSIFGYVIPSYDVRDPEASPVLRPRVETERLQASGAAAPNPPPPAPRPKSNEWIFGG